MASHIIIRLENLTWNATSVDIREFFKGLTIPEGGVHIVGGEKSEAFIAFASDEDARLAMEKTGNLIKDGKIKLFLSSRNEMQRVIEQARNQSAPPPMINNNMPPTIMPGGPPLVSSPLVDGRLNKDKDIKDNMDRRRIRSRSNERRHDRSLDNGRNRHRRDRSRSPRRRSRERGRERIRRDDRRRSDDRMPERDSFRDKGPRGKPDEIGMGNKGKNPEFGENRNVSRFNQTPPNQWAPPFPNDGPPQNNNMWQEEPKGNGPFPNEMNRNPMRNEGMRGPEPKDSFPPRDEGMFNPRDGRNPPGRQNIPEDNNNFNTFGKKTGNDFSRPNPRMGSFNSERRSLDMSPGKRNRQDFGPPKSDDRSGGFPFNPNFGPPNNGQQNESMPSTDDSSESWRPPQEQFKGPGDVPSSMRQGPNFKDNMPFDNRGGRPNNRNMHGRGSDFNNPEMGGMSGDFERHGSRPNRPIQFGFCVELRSMPPHASYRNIRDLMRGLYISSDAIKLVHENNRRTGLGYVRLANDKDLQEALTRSGTFLDGIVDISKCDDEAFEQAIDPNFSRHDYNPPQMPRENFNKRPHMNDEFVLMIRGLPYNCSKGDVISFFHGTPIAVYIEFDKDGKAIGTGFVVFSNFQDMQNGLSLNRQKIGHRYIEISESSKEAMINNGCIMPSPNKQDDMPNKMPRMNMRQNPTETPPSCVAMQGLPPNVTIADISSLFSTINIIPSKTHICLGPNLTPRGDAFVEFLTQQDFQKALSKSSTFIEKNVTLSPIHYHEMRSILERPQRDQGPNFDPAPNDMNNRGGDMDNRRRPLMDAPWRADFQRGGFPQNGPRHRPQFNPRGGGDMRMPRGGGQMQMQPRRPPMGRPNAPQPSSGIEGFGKPGCILGISDIPPHAGVNDILNFIKNFNLTKENVLRRFDDQGKPTGDARVALNSPQEAQRAVAELNNQLLADNLVKVFLVS